MKVQITAKHLENAVYINNEDCPLARALKMKGYKKVFVRGYSVEGYKGKKMTVWSFPSFWNEIANRKPFTVNLTIQSKLKSCMEYDGDGVRHNGARHD